MQVKKLIELLQSFDGEQDVFIADPTEDMLHSVDYNSVEVYTDSDGTTYPTEGVDDEELNDTVRDAVVLTPV